MLSGLPEESAQALKEVSQTDQQAARRMEELLGQLEQGRRSLGRSKAEQARLSPWRDLDLTWDELQQGLGYTRFRLGILPATAWEDLSGQDTPIGYTLVSQSAGRCCLLAAAVEPEGLTPPPRPAGSGGTVPLAGHPCQQLNRLEQQMHSPGTGAGAADPDLEGAGGGRRSARPADGTVPAKSQRKRSLCGHSGNGAAGRLDSQKEKQEKLEKLLNQTGLPYGLDCRDPLPEESPPTLLENSKTVRQFEALPYVQRP